MSHTFRIVTVVTPSETELPAGTQQPFYHHEGAEEGATLSPSTVSGAKVGGLHPAKGCFTWEVHSV